MSEKRELEGVKQLAARHTAVMIWLGIFIDAIPESLVIGFMVGNGQVMRSSHTHRHTHTKKVPG